MKEKMVELEKRIELLEKYIEIQAQHPALSIPSLGYTNLYWCPICRIYNCGQTHITC